MSREIGVKLPCFIKTWELFLENSEIINEVKLSKLLSYAELRE